MRFIFEIIIGSSGIDMGIYEEQGHLQSLCVSVRTMTMLVGD